jgi:putative hydrolase of the HAD superfamily
VRDEYYQLMDEQRKAFPEIDAVELWREYLRRRPEACQALHPEKLKWMPQFLAEMYRGISRYRLQLYPEVKSVLDELSQRCKLAALSDAQSACVPLPLSKNPLQKAGDGRHRRHPQWRLWTCITMST